MSGNILEKILQRKMEEVQTRSQATPLAALLGRLIDAPVVRPFQQALLQKTLAQQPAVIAEIKKASPSKGVIRQEFNPAQIARQYEAAGAACLSVLTDEDFFQGHDLFLQQARAACQLPVLRKDFIIDPYQIYEARVLGADCILLIVAALDDDQLHQFNQLGLSLSMDVLVEVHDQHELERALQLQGVDDRMPLLGINNRDLRTFDVSLQNSITLKQHVPDNQLVIAESGIHTQEDIRLLQQHGIHAYLIGEAFMRADDPGAALATLLKEAAQ